MTTTPPTPAAAPGRAPADLTATDMSMIAAALEFRAEFYRRDWPMLSDRAEALAARVRASLRAALEGR